MATFARFVAHVTCSAGFGFCASSNLATSVWCQEPRAFELKVEPPVLLTNTEAPPAPSDQPFSPVTWGVKWNAAWDSQENPERELDSTYINDDGQSSRGPVAETHHNSKALRQLLLIRHGQYQNESNKEAAEEERSLTTTGVAQARATGLFLSHALQHRSGNQFFVASELDAIHVSDLTRARQTAEYILESFSPSQRARLRTPDSLLREKFPCDPEPVYEAKKAKTKHMKLSEEAFHKYFHRPTPANRQTNTNTVELIVGHGNMIRYFLCRSLQLPPEAWLRFAIPHCSITSLVIRSDGTVKIIAFGSFSHLAPALQTVANVSHAA